jgi:MFS transporter, NNP family, nitrate/nitrite transporter
MVWVMLGPLAVQIAHDLGLSAAQKGLLVATPVLAGVLLRAVAGILVDHLKPKKAGVTGQLIVLSGLAWAQFGGISSFQQILVLGMFLGMAGAAFAVALPSRTPLAARDPLLLWRSIAVIALILNLILLYLLSAR